MGTKKCSTCKKEKDLLLFFKNSKNNDGLRYDCKECSNIVKRNYSIKNKVSIEKNKKEYRKKNKESISEYNKKYHIQNKEKISQRKKNFKSIPENREKINQYMKEWTKKRREKDSLFKIACSLRGRINRAFNSKFWKKNGNTQKLLGESFEFVHKYIEVQFTKGMNWENYGEWHIDHKIPLYYAKNEEHLKSLCHYTNLQPLWANENLVKNKSIIVHQTKLL